jgi:hypothetical protein
MDFSNHHVPAPDADPDKTEDALKDCLLYYPEILDAFPLNFPNLAIEQANDTAVQALLEHDQYEVQEFYGTHLVCRHDNNNDQWKIVLPKTLIDPAINWYHHVLGHVGTARLCQTLRTHCWIRKLQQ